MDLADIRQAIDGIDTTLLNSFVERMDIATEVAKSKIEMARPSSTPLASAPSSTISPAARPSATRHRPSPCSVSS